MGEHRGQVQLIGAGGAHRGAYHPGGVPHRETHQLLGGVFGRKNNIALILAALIIYHDHCAPGGNRIDCALNRIECPAGPVRGGVLPRLRGVECQQASHILG